MQKKRAIIFLFLTAVLILSLSFASAFSFQEFFSKITGRAILDSDLIAHYKFENNVDNEKLGGASASGNPTYTVGKSGNAITFDGIDDYIYQNTLSSASISPVTGTFALWANFDSSITSDGKAHVLVGAGNSNSDTNYISLRKVIESNKLVMRYRIQGVVYDAGVSAAPLGWNHIVGTWNQTSVSLYVNGALNGQTSLPQNTVPLFNQFRIGAREFQTPLFYFKGQIDDIKVFIRALTAQEVLDLYNSYSPPPPPPAVCGNDIIESEEICDGNSQACTINNQAGTQTCNAQCSGWNACVADPIVQCSEWSTTIKNKIQELRLKGYQVGTLEGEVTKALNYILINTGNGGSLFKTGATYSYNNITGIFLTDTISNVQYTATLNVDKKGLFTINGQNYYAYPFKSGVTSLLKITWGDGASYNNPGTATDSYVDCFGTIPSCYDSDKNEIYPDGKNYYVKGNVTNEGSSAVYDSCSTTDSNILGEQICTKSTLDSTRTTFSYTCPNGCLDGACLQPIPDVNRCPSLSNEVKSRTLQEQLLGRTLVLKEGGSIYRVDANYNKIYFVIDDGNGGKIMRVIRIFNDTSRYYNDIVEIEDVILGQIYSAIITEEGKAALTIGGTTFRALYNDDGSIENDEYIFLTWGDGSSYGNVGSERTYFDCSTKLDLLAHYKFENNVQDSSSSLKHGTSYGDLTYPSSIEGNAINFDGINDYVDINSLSSMISPNKGTIAFWIRIDPSIRFDNEVHSILGAGKTEGNKNFISFKKTNKNEIVFRHRIAGTDYNAIFYPLNTDLSNWHYITGAWNDKEIKLYIDGEQAAFKSKPSSSVIFNTFRIGVKEFQAPDAQFFKGNIDDLQIYNKELSNEEIQALFLDYIPSSADMQVSIGTLKDSYAINEPIQLTDPPDETETIPTKAQIPPATQDSIITEETYIEDSIINYQSPTENIPPQEQFGYIIKFKENPIAVEQVKLKEKAKRNEEIIKENPIITTITGSRFFATREADVPDKVKQHKEELKTEHKRAKDKIKQKLYKSETSSITGNIIARITGKAIDDSTFEQIALAEYDTAFNGLALDISAEEAELLKSISEVESVSPSFLNDLNLVDSIPLINADDVWQLDVNGNNCIRSGNECLTGKGVKIAVIDTGVDYTHSDLGGGSFPNSKVVGGYDFSGDSFVDCSSEECINNIAPDVDPLDNNGHGTHVAAIAAGQFNVISKSVTGQHLFSFNNIGNKIEVSVPVTDGIAKFNLLYGEGNQFNGWGSDEKNNIFIPYHGLSTTILFDEEEDEMFIVSASGETHILRAEIIDDSHINIHNLVTGEVISNIGLNDYIDIGRITLKIFEIDTTEREILIKPYNYNIRGPLQKIYDIQDNYIKLSYPPSSFPSTSYIITIYDKTDSIIDFYIASFVNGNTKISRADNIKISGVAPDAQILAYKVFPNAYDHIIISAIEKAVQDGADIISMSLGKDCFVYWEYCGPEDVVSQAVDNAADAGVVVVVAAGNSGPSEKTIVSPGTARKAITVGATDKNNNIASFSSRGPVLGKNLGLAKPDIVAPGVSICAAKRNDPRRDSSYTWYWRWCIDDNHLSLQGTSMATPHVSGGVALLIQKNPDWSPEEIKKVLKNTAINIQKEINMQGSGRIDILNAVNSEKPLVANIQTGGQVKGTIDIIGTASGNNYMGYSLYYKEKYGNNWIEIITSNEAIIKGVLYNGFNTADLDDGIYYLKLVAKNNNEKLTEDVSVIDVKNFNLQDIIKDEKTYNFLGSIGGRDFDSFTAEYGVGNNPVEWSNEGIFLVNNGKSQIFEGLLASWDTSTISEANYYTIRFNVLLKDGRTISKNIENIYLDPEQKEGWPIQLSYKSPDDIIYEANEVSYAPIIADLNSDGKLETVVVGNIPLYPLTLSIMGVYTSEGNPYQGWPLLPLGEEIRRRNTVLGDLNNDGFMEIITGSTRFLGNKLTVWSHDGKIMNGWPKDFGEFNLQNLILSDINNDGYLDIIAFGFYMSDIRDKSTNINKIYAWNFNGDYLESFPLEFSGKIFKGSVIGDLVGDNNKEIIISTSNTTINLDSELIMLDIAGNEIFKTSLPVYDLYNPVLGDLNNDGDLEIIVSGTLLERISYDLPPVQTGKIFVINKDGSLVWTQNVGVYPKHISLADFNNDGKLEIVVATASNVIDTENSISVLDYEGNIKEGWPVTFGNEKCNRGFFDGTVIGDLNNDKNLEIVALCSYGQTTTMYTWNDKGIQLNSKIISESSETLGSISLVDLDNNDKIDIVVGGKDNSVFAYELSGDYIKKDIPWPMFQHDPQHTGYLPQSPPTPPQSKIVNNENQDIAVKVVVKIQKQEGTEWTDTNQQYAQLTTIPANNLIKLDAIINPMNFRIQEAGNYRVHLSLRKANDEIITNPQGQPLETSYEFTVGTIGTEAYFKFEYPLGDENTDFIFKLTDQVKIENARRILRGEELNAVHVEGTIVKSPEAYNPGWSYHLAPDSIQFFENAAEVCDAAAPYVEEHLAEVGGAVLPDNWWCPWDSILIEEVV